MRNRFVPGYLIATAIVLLVIVYGSLYPFEFHEPAGGVGPLATLILTWRVPSAGLGDLAANILLYVPLGFFGALSIRSGKRIGNRLVLPIALGLVLCVAMELAQYYDAGRVTSLADVYLNTSGTALGALAGMIVGSDFRWPYGSKLFDEPVPCLLFIAWLGYRLFPYVPTTDLHKYWDALKPIVLTPSLPPYDIFRYTVMWLTISHIIEAILGQNRSRVLIPTIVAATFAAKVMIVTKVLTVAEIIGAMLAFSLWLVALRASTRMRFAAATGLLAALVVAERLEPFYFTPFENHFGWIPFLSLMNGSLEVNIQSFLEKFFLYGSLIWLLTVSGMRLTGAAIVVSATLFLTSMAEIYLPNRSAEITDAVMALLIAAMFGLTGQVSKNAKSVALQPQPPRNDVPLHL
jgi:VanZ family protein